MSKTKASIIARPVIKDGFWLAYDRVGTKIGVITPAPNHYNFFDTINEEDHQLSADDIVFEETLLTETQETSPGVRVDGYPTDCSEVFDTDAVDIKNHEDQDVSIPVFSKKKGGKRRYAAGYYVLKFQSGYTEAFTPTVSNLESNYAAGPYKTEADMKIVVRQLKNG